MTALPPDQMRAMREPGTAERVGTLAGRWDELHDTANKLAAIAGLASESPHYGRDVFAAKLSDASAWQRDLARQGIDDMEAMVEPGVRAIGTLQARGSDASVPAQALWRELHHALEAVLAMVEPRSKLVQNA